jgi:hypothetical protein
MEEFIINNQNDILELAKYLNENLKVRTYSEETHMSVFDMANNCIAHIWLGNHVYVDGYEGTFYTSNGDGRKYYQRYDLNPSRYELDD